MSKTDSGEEGCSCNKYVNGPRGRVLGDKGPPKSTHDGADIGPDATNKIGASFTNKILSPNSEAASATNEDSREGGRDAD